MRAFSWIIFFMLSGTSLMAGVTAPDRIYMPLGSLHYGDLEQHLDDGDTLQEFNIGVIATWQDRGQRALDYSLGLYRNSLGDPTIHSSIAKMWDASDDLSYGVVATLAVPLDDRSSTSAYVIPSLQVNYKNTFVLFTGAPYGGEFYGVVGFGLTFAL